MRSGVTLALALSGTLTLAVASTIAQADDPPTTVASAKHDLDEADNAYANVDFEGASKFARLALDRRSLTHDELVRGYRMIARTAAVLDRADESRAAYVMLLTLSPDEKDDKNLPPKMTDRLAEARGVISGYAVRPGLDATAALRQREAGAIRVVLHDPAHVTRHVVVAYRWTGEGAFVSQTSAAVDTLAVVVAPPPPGVSRFDFYAQALDDHDSVLFESGTSDAPRTTSLALVEIAPPPPRVIPPPPPTPHEATHRSVFASPVFWVIATGAVVVGGVVLFAATRSGSPTSVSLSPSLECGGVRCN
jgi:hypothetical protein